LNFLHLYCYVSFLVVYPSTRYAHLYVHRDVQMRITVCYFRKRKTSGI